MMTRKVFDQLKRFCRNYDPFTQYIDSFRQKESADEANHEIEKEFNTILAEYTDEKIFGIPWTCNNCTGETLETNLTEYLNKLGIEVEPRRIWSEEEIANLIQTNNAVLLNTFRKLDSFAVDTTFLAKGDKSYLKSVASFYYKNKAITNNQAAVIRKIFAKYTTQLTALANQFD